MLYEVITRIEMPRVKRGVQARAKHKKVLAKAKGYYGARSRVYRVAHQAVIKAGNRIENQSRPQNRDRARGDNSRITSYNVCYTKLLRE